MRIQSARSRDLNPALALLAAQFAEHGIALGGEALRIAVEGLVADEERGALLVAYDPDPVGVAVLAYTWTLEHGGRVGWIDELFVLPAHRGRGVGRALLREALEVAQEKGCRAVELEVDADHRRAENLYRREGFESLPRRRWSRRLASQ